MPHEIRSIGVDEVDTMLQVDARAFGTAPQVDVPVRTWTEGELERTRCAFDGDEMVGVSRAYSFEVTLPGGARLPAAAVSWVSVLPTYRRRGILRQMLAALHADARDRGEPVAALTASESRIYGRFGYGIATWRAVLSVDTRAASVVSPLAGDGGGRVRLVERDEAEKLLPSIYDRARDRAGMVSRPDFWWPQQFWRRTRTEEAFLVAVHHDAAGVPDGYAAYQIGGDWEHGLADRRLTVWDLQPASDRAHAALWRFLLETDLVATVTAAGVAVDDPLRLLVDDARRARIVAVNDGLWLCPLDPAALLAARTYAIEGALVLEVHDPAGGGTRLGLDGGPDGASCATTTRTADVVCSSATLGACALGGNPWSAYARAGYVEERTAGALRRADLMFSTQPAPAMLSHF